MTYKKEPITICAQCRWADMNPHFPECLHPENSMEPMIDVVTGKTCYGKHGSKKRYPECRHVNNGDCAHFESKNMGETLSSMFKTIYDKLSKKPGR